MPGPGSPNGPPPIGNFPFGIWEVVRLIVMVTAAAGVGWFLARSFANPLTKLRSVTRQIAGGDFSARVGDSLGKSADEIVKLGCDFDTMAAATEQLILSRQRLLRDISHELRSPLARLNVALELARQRYEACNDNNLATIEKESNRLNELIEHLLILARLEHDEEYGEPLLINLPMLILKIVEDANFESLAKEQKITATFLEELYIKGYPELIHRAVENIVRNAARYTATQTEVEVSLQQQAGMAVVQVADHGPGVPVEELEAIFQPFYRVATARDRQSGGTGLGLAIARQTATRHGGKIEAVNAVNGGLIVRMYLPLTAEERC